MIEVPYVPPTRITINTTNQTLYIGGVNSKTRINAVVHPPNASYKDVTWSSENNNAVVDNGVVAALHEGEALITATTKDLGLTATCLITIIDDALRCKLTGSTVPTEEFGENVFYCSNSPKFPQTMINKLNIQKEQYFISIKFLLSFKFRLKTPNACQMVL